MGKGKPVVSRTVISDVIPVRPAIELPFLSRPFARSLKFRGIREGLMQKRKPLASNAALLAALILSGQSVAFADKGGVGPHPAAIPNVNLGLPAIPKMGTGVSLPAAAMAATAGPGSTPLGGSGPGQSVGNGVSAQVAAPGATRSASSSGLTPPGQDHSRGAPAGDQRSAQRNNGYESGNPGLGQSQGKGEDQDSGTLTAAPSDPVRPLPERLAAAQSQSGATSGKSPDQLPTCR